MFKNGFYNIVGAAVRLGISILTVPILIHIIGIEEYGLWVLVSAAVGLIALADTGFSMSTTIFIARDLANQDNDGIVETLTVIIGAMLLLATLISLMFFWGADILADLFPTLQEPQRVVAQQALQISGLVIWTRMLQQIFVGIEQAYHQYGVMNAIGTGQALLSGLGMLAVAWLGGQTIALMQWQVVVTAAGMLIHAVVVWRLLHHVQLRPRWNSAKSRTIMRYSGLTWLVSLGGVLFGQGDRVIVGGLLGTHALGVYAAITNITVQINSFSALPVQPLLPTISSFWARKDVDNLSMRQRIQQALHINALIALGMGAGLFVFAPLITKLIIPGVYSNEYTVIFQIAVVIYALYSVNAVGYYVLFAVDAIKTCMYIRLVSGIATLLFVAVGASMWGITGAIIGNVGYLLVFLITIFGMKELQIPNYLWVKWLRFPVMWFFLTVLVVAIPSDYSIKVLILTVQCTVLGIWFVRVQYYSLQSLFRRLIIR
jgi:O-antigen/teichoic acid export membrane protein